MSDRLVRGTFPEKNIRFAACETGLLCSDGLQRLSPDWVSSWIFAEALTCSALMSVGLADGERLSMRWKYPGPMGMVLADLDEFGNVRGFPQRRLMPEISTVVEALGGEGTMSVTSSFPNRVGRRGTTPAIFQDITRDLAHFLSLSFQIETGLVVGLIIPPEAPIRLLAATGLLIQPLPGCDLPAFGAVRDRLERPEFREWLEEAPRTAEAALERLEVGEPPQYLEEVTPSYLCNCSRTKVTSVLQLLGSEELLDMLENDGMAEIDCHFCAEHYHFSRTDLQALLEQSHAGHA